MHQLESPLLVDNPQSDAASVDDVDTENFRSHPTGECFPGAGDPTVNLGTPFKHSSPDPCLCVFDWPECCLNEYSVGSYNYENVSENPNQELTFRPVQFSGNGGSQKGSSNLPDIPHSHSEPPGRFEPVFASNDSSIYLSSRRNSDLNSLDLLKINTNLNGAGTSFVDPHNIHRHQSLPTNSLKLHRTKTWHNQSYLQSPIHEITTGLASSNNPSGTNPIHDSDSGPEKLIDIDSLKRSKTSHSTTMSKFSIGHQRRHSYHKNLSHIAKPKVKIVNVGQINHNTTTKTKVKVGNPFYKPRYKSWSA
jgi:hypothetical protein